MLTRLPGPVVAASSLTVRRSITLMRRLLSVAGALGRASAGSRPGGASLSFPGIGRIRPGHQRNPGVNLAEGLFMREQAGPGISARARGRGVTREICRAERPL